MIVLIHGNAGVGKSTVARQLHGHFDHSIVLEVDRFRYHVIDERVESDQIDLCDQQVISTADAFLEDAYDTVIIEGVYPSQNHLRNVCTRLHHIDPELYVYRLACSLSENIKRDQERDDELTVGKKVEEVYESFVRLDPSEEVGCVVETTELSPEETVQNIEQLLEKQVGKVD